MAAMNNRIPLSGWSVMPGSVHLRLCVCVGLILFALLQPLVVAGELDDAARYLAGLPPSAESAYATLTDAHWQGHKQRFDTAWQALDQERFEPMRQWQAEVLASEIDPSLPVFYPFGGPDMVHALMLYPQGRAFLLFGLEPPGSLELAPALSENARHRLLDAVDWALRDIYQRSYFITGRMSSDLNRKLDGVLPLLLVFLARSGYEITAIEPGELAPDGQFAVAASQNADSVVSDAETEGSIESDEPVVSDESIKTTDFVSPKAATCPAIPGVRVRFKASDDPAERQVTYLQLDVSDAGLGGCEALNTYVERLAPVNTFVKSASYLMHYGTFSRIRELTLAVSASLFQDDTGVPYRALDQAQWSLRLFGGYTKPIRDFDGVYQSDLNQAYLSAAHRIDQLPFSMGYHWWTSAQNHLLALKLKASLKTPLDPSQPADP
jgi:hypothetical protein